MRNLIFLNAAALLWSAWPRRYLIAIPIVVMPLLGVAVGLVAPKKYEAYTTILIQEAAKQNPFLQDLTVATNLNSRMEALRALLHSRHILAEVAFRLKLTDKAMPEDQRNTIIAELSKSLKVKLVGDDLVKLTYVAGSPGGMEELLKLVSLRFVERVIAPQRSAIFNSETFLAKELESRQDDLSNAEQRLAEYKSRFASELPELHAANVVSLSRMRELLAERRISLEGARAARESLRTQLARTNPVIGRIEEEIVQVLSDLAVLRARYTDHHSKVQAALQKVRGLETERAKALRAADSLKPQELERLWNLAASQTAPTEGAGQPLLVSQLQRLQEADSQVRGLEEEVASLEKERTALEVKVSAFGEHELRLSALERDISVKRRIHDDLAERHQKALVTGALGRAEESERVKLIDPPFTPTAPTNLPLIVFLAAGIAGGFAMGLGLALAAELMDTTVWRRDTVARLLDVPVLTRIPVLPNDGFDLHGDRLDPALFGSIDQAETSNA